MIEPYYSDDWVTLYHGDFRDVLPELGVTPDLVVADPPYGETSLDWDRWPVGWPGLMPGRSMWCFGSMRMFLDRRGEFADWRMSQDVVWEKQNGSGFTTDRFKRVHEHATHWYRGDWADLHHETPRDDNGGKQTTVRRRKALTADWHGVRGPSLDVRDGTTYVRSVIYAPNMHGTAINATEKPRGVLEPLIQYGCPVKVQVLGCVRCGHEYHNDVSALWRELPIEARPEYRLEVRPTSVLQPEVQGESPGKASDGLPSLSDSVPCQTSGTEVLFSEVRECSEAAGRAAVRDVRNDISARSGVAPVGGSTPPQQRQGRQSSGQPRTPTKTRPRPDPEAIPQADQVPALLGPDRHIGSCPDCGGALASSKRPGLVLDPFAGSCSTLVAARATGRRAIGIEKREEQCELAVTARLSQSVMTFDDV